MSLYKRKDSKYYWVKIAINGQKPVYESTGTTDRQQAREYEAKRLNEIWEQTRLGIKPKYLWEEAVVKYIDETSHSKSHSTDLTFFRWLSKYLDGVYLNDINRALLDRITSIRKKEGNASNATVNRYMQIVSRVLRRAALDWEWIDKTIKVRSLPEPKIRIRFLTPEEVTRLMNELPPHLEVMVRFSLATGLRKSNVTGLMWSQVNMQDRCAWIHADQAKGKRAIPVPLSSEAMDVLRKLLLKHPTHVFTFRGKPIKQVNTKAWQAALKRARIVDFRWHDLRHTWASWHVQNGTPIYVLKELGGWADMDMVQKYAHLSPGHLSQHVENVSGIIDSEVKEELVTNWLRSGL